MSYESSTSYSGNKSFSTLGGQIRIEEGRGRLVIYDSVTAKELNVVDRTGYLFSDSSTRRIKIGYAPDDSRVGIWESKSGIDVIQKLGG